MYYDKEDLGNEAYLETRCGQCQGHEDRLKMSAHFFEGIVKVLYSRHDIKVSDLKFMLGELGFYLGVDVPAGEIQVERKDRLKYLDHWVESNIDYLKSLRKGGVDAQE